MPYQTFRTRRQAILKALEMPGWEPYQAVLMYLPGDTNADTHGNTWVIRCTHSMKYLRTNGYVY